MSHTMIALAAELTDKDEQIARLQARLDSYIATSRITKDELSRTCKELDQLRRDHTILQQKYSRIAQATYKAGQYLAEGVTIQEERARDEEEVIPFGKVKP